MKQTTIPISVIIPNRNKRSSLAHCLKALYHSSFKHFEVIVVDDASDDDSTDVANKFPCTLIQLPRRLGAAAARNIGAGKATGRVLFFIDSDCIVEKETTDLVMRAFEEAGDRVVVGGTYTEKPFDPGFFNFFQSVFIHYSETRNPLAPDYIATHALAIRSEEFRQEGGFAEGFMPILEDVEFTHRLRRRGYRLVMCPDILVRHIFQFGLWESLANGFVKAKYWLAYSLANKDMLADSGTASIELKWNLATFASLIFALAFSLYYQPILLLIPGVTVPLNLVVTRKLLQRFFKAGGALFGLRATLYFLFFYPSAVIAGAGSGLIYYLRNKFLGKPWKTKCQAKEI